MDMMKGAMTVSGASNPRHSQHTAQHQRSLHENCWPVQPTAAHAGPYKHTCLKTALTCREERVVGRPARAASVMAAAVGAEEEGPARAACAAAAASRIARFAAAARGQMAVG